MYAYNAHSSIHLIPGQLPILLAQLAQEHGIGHREGKQQAISTYIHTYIHTYVNILEFRTYDKSQP